MTLWLNPLVIEQCLDPLGLVESMRKAFHSLGGEERADGPQRVSVSLSGVMSAPDNALATILLPGCTADIPAYTVKVHSKYPDNPRCGRPAIQGQIHLFDAATGSLLAMLDSPLLTAHRTAAASAVAADVLALPDAHSMAIIGAGVQAELHFQYISRLREIHQVSVFDVNPDASRNFANRRQAEGYACATADSVHAAVQTADLVVTSTWAREPFLFLDMVRPGTHITTVGPDSPGKAEVGEDLIRASRFFCDQRELAFRMGALQRYAASDIPAYELADVLRGQPGRMSREDITVYGSVGLPFQDLVAAWGVYQRAQRQGLGVNLPG